MRTSLFALMVVASGCGISLRRDLSSLPAQSVVYDDMCGVQAYHDAIDAGKNQPPRVLESKDFAKGNHDRPQGGTVTFAFEDDFNLGQLRKILAENWERIPASYLSAPRVLLAVEWAEKAGVRRVITTEEAQIYDGKKLVYLPYHICLSELLYGGPLYKTRRAMLNLPPVEGVPAASARPAP